MDKTDNLFKEVVTKNIVSVNDGRLKILETMDITMYGSKAWAFTLQKIGTQKDKEFLFELGLLMGSDAAQEIKELFNKKKAFLNEKIKKTESIVQLLGFGIIEIDEKSLAVNIRKNHIIDYSNSIYKEKSIVHYFYAGVYSAFLQEFFGIEKNLRINKKGKKITLKL